MKSKGKILVVGMGNLLRRDEGVGVHVIREMERIPLPNHMELLDMGTSTLDLVSHLDAVDKLVVIDAMKAGGEPGTIYKCAPEDLIPKEEGPISLHEIGLLESLSMTKKMGKQVETVVIGVEPENLGWGLEISDTIRARIPDIVEAVLKEG